MDLTKITSRVHDQSTNYLPTAIESLNIQSAALSTIAKRLGGELEDAVRLILSCSGRVIVSGMGKSGLVGKKIAATLASTGTPSFYVHPGEAIHGDLGMITPDDLIIMISYSGETEEVLKLIPSLKYFGNKIIGMVGSDSTTLGKQADVTLRVDIEREVCPNNLAPTTSALATMALGDALAVCLIRANNFKPSDFAQFHPGGMLGRRLLSRVGDTMVVDNLPLIGPEESVREAMFCMTSGRLGLAIVVDDDRLLGILTDGDLRRSMIMDSTMLEKRVKDFMTPAPVTISSNAMLTEAEVLMRKFKIRALIVTSEREGEQNHVCGVLEIFSNQEK